MKQELAACISCYTQHKPVSQRAGRRSLPGSRYVHTELSPAQPGNKPHGATAGAGKPWWTQQAAEGWESDGSQDLLAGSGHKAWGCTTRCLLELCSALQPPSWVVLSLAAGAPWLLHGFFTECLPYGVHGAKGKGDLKWQTRGLFEEAGTTRRT